MFRYVMLNEREASAFAVVPVDKKKQILRRKTPQNTDGSKATGGVKNVQFRELKQL